MDPIFFTHHAAALLSGHQGINPLFLHPEGNLSSFAYRALPLSDPSTILGNETQQDPLLLLPAGAEIFPGIFNDPQLLLDSAENDAASGNFSSFEPNGTGSYDFQNEMDTHRVLSGIAEFFFFMICVVGLCGNTLVIYVVLRYSKMQTVTNLYILNLAVADECFLIGLPFLFVTSLMHHWPFGYVMCKVYMTTTGINQFTSSAFLTVMSGDRYVAICHAVKATSYRTPLVSRVVALTTWMVSALLMAPLFMYSSTKVTNNTTGVTTCSVFLPETGIRNNYVVFTLYNLVASFVIPLAFIIIFYSQVIATLRNTKASRKKNTRKKVTRLVLTVIIAYVICWLPYWLGQVALIVQALELVNLPISHMGLVNYNIVASIPMYCNSAINPILYAFLSDNFRKSFFKACTWCSFLQGRGGWLGGTARQPGGRMMIVANRGVDTRDVPMEDDDVDGDDAEETPKKAKNRKNRLKNKKKGFKALTGAPSLTTTSNWPRATTTSYAGCGYTRTEALTPVPDRAEVEEANSQVTNIWDSDKLKRRAQQSQNGANKVSSSLLVTDAIVTADLVSNIFAKQNEERGSELESEEEIDVSALLLMNNGRNLGEEVMMDDLKPTRVALNHPEVSEKVVCKLVDQEKPQVVLARNKDFLTSDL